MNEWKTFDTAPKDGSWFLAYRGKAKIGTCDRLVIVRWSDDLSDFIWPDKPFDIYEDDIDERDGNGYYVIQPYCGGGTFEFWMPLPKPPKD